VHRELAGVGETCRRVARGRRVALRWNGGDAFRSAFFNALSMNLPRGDPPAQRDGPRHRRMSGALWVGRRPACKNGAPGYARLNRPRASALDGPQELGLEQAQPHRIDLGQQGRDGRIAAPEAAQRQFETTELFI
jgi:hypothetical protein